MRPGVEIQFNYLDPRPHSPPPAPFNSEKKIVQLLVPGYPLIRSYPHSLEQTIPLIKTSFEKKKWPFEKIIEIHQHFNARDWNVPKRHSGTSHDHSELMIYLELGPQFPSANKKSAQNYWRHWKKIWSKYHLQWIEGSTDISSIITPNSWNTQVKAANSSKNSFSLNYILKYQQYHEKKCC